MTSKEISERLTLSVRTVGRHITNIYRKIGVNSRAGATSYALLQGIASE
jgi:DNA-binding NarL/FixJ family response regulator